MTVVIQGRRMWSLSPVLVLVGTDDQQDDENSEHQTSDEDDHALSRHAETFVLRSHGKPLPRRDMSAVGSEAFSFLRYSLARGQISLSRERNDGRQGRPCPARTSFRSSHGTDLASRSPGHSHPSRTALPADGMAPPYLRGLHVSPGEQ